MTKPFLYSLVFLSFFQLPVVYADGFVDVHMHLDGVQSQGRGERGEPPQQMTDRDANNMPPMARRKMMMRRRRAMIMRREQGSQDSTASADQLIRMMNEHGVEKVLVMPPPQKQNQKGGYDYRALLDSVEKYPSRLYLGAGGGMLNPLIHSTDPGAVTDQVRMDFQQKAEELINAGAHAFGEMTAMHTCMNPKHHYIATAPDHPLFLLLADLAAKYNVPIDLHMEAIVEDMATPSNLLSACKDNPKVLPATIPGFERLLAHNRSARIVWQHIGWDNTGQMTPELLKALLAKHPNLYLAVKATPPEKEPVRRNRIHDDQYQIVNVWFDLFKAFPDRIVVGADEFARAEGMRGGYRKPPFFEVTWATIGRLPQDLRQKIGRENAERIYRLNV